MDDFLLTSMASQLGSLDFIGEGSTKRKEILAKFLDLEIFDKKFKLAKDDASDLKAILKRLEVIDFDAESEILQTQLTSHNKEVSEQKDTCSILRGDIATSKASLVEIQSSIDAIPAVIINIEEVTKLLEEQKRNSHSLENKNKKLKEESDENRNTITKIDSLCNEFNIDEWNDKQEMVRQKKDALDGVLRLIREKEAIREVEEKKIQLLNEVPCGESFPQCKFIKDAFTALESIGITKKDLDEARGKEGEMGAEILSLQPDVIAQYIEKHRQVVEKRATTETKINKIELQVAKNKTKVLNIDSEIRNLSDKIAEYEENRDAIENLEHLIANRKEKTGKVRESEDKLTKCENRLTELYKESGSLTQQLESLSEQKEELSEAREEYAAYDLFMRCVHTNGISLDIIKNRLPIINAEIASTLANIVDFEVYVEDIDKRLEIFIKHPKFSARPLEMGSGAEKTIAAMAIRLSLLSVSSMPKGDIFILDEPGTALDEENMEGFVRILDLVKTHFKTVLLISHQEALKDSVDSQISIEKKDGFAFVNH
jgi:DNA repair exonuclease SbcCD ATPase subunit